MREFGAAARKSGAWQHRDCNSGGVFGLCNCPMTCHRLGHILWGTAPIVTFKGSSGSGVGQLPVYITEFRKRTFRHLPIIVWAMSLGTQPIAAKGHFGTVARVRQTKTPPVEAIYINIFKGRCSAHNFSNPFAIFTSRLLQRPGDPFSPLNPLVCLTEEHILRYELYPALAFYPFVSHLHIFDRPGSIVICFIIKNLHLLTCTIRTECFPASV